jgi:signal recognition particle subunit SRP54
VFEGLIDRFQVIRRKILGYGRITKTEVDAVLRDIRVTLLEADVHYLVVKEFVETLGKKAEALELVKSLNPGDLMIKTVYEELVELLGKTPKMLEFKQSGPTIICLIGLQGVGKTTTAGKLALRYKSKHPLLVPADAKRPAAVEQLTMLAERIDVPVFPLQKNSALETCVKALEQAREAGHSIVIIDTAGRLHIDEELVAELAQINQAVKPHYRLLVCDGMAGQDAVNQAKTFQEKIGLEGAILTKMDGDSRGGAALSIRRVAQVPIYFIGTSEHSDGIEIFYPDRIGQRILGMGDMTSLVEKVQSLEQAGDREKMQKKIAKGDLNLADFMEQMKTMKKLGPLSKLASMIPGVKEADVDEKEFQRIEAIIGSMTVKERNHPDLIDGSRKRRIAQGSGTTVADVNQLLKQFFYARDMLKKMSKGKGKKPGKMPFPM